MSNHPEPMLKNSTHFFISVIREGSRMFDALELHRTSAKSPCTPCFSSKYVDRGGSVVSNQPEPMLKNSTHFAIPAIMWFKKVRGGSTSSSNLHEPHHHRDSKVCRGLSHEFGWFDCTEPSLSTSLQGKQGVQGAYAIVRGGSST